MDGFVRDLRDTLRALRRSPGFTLVAVLSLAVGIGVNTAVFSLVDAVLFRSLPGRSVGLDRGATDRTVANMDADWTDLVWTVRELLTAAQNDRHTIVWSSELPTCAAGKGGFAGLALCLRLTVLGFGAFTSSLRGAGDRLLSELGLLAYVFGALLWIISLAFRLTVEVWAA